MLEARLAPAVFNVNSTADILSPPTGTVTLRSAIQAANATPGGNTINLTIAGIYRITLVGTPGETDNAAGEFAILPSGGNLSINNTSGGTVVVDGNYQNRVFDINPNPGPTPDFTVSMQAFAIQHGAAIASDVVSGSGGGIRDQSNASLTLTNMTVTNNLASADGGGVAMKNQAIRSWTLTVTFSTISANQAGNAGGGIETDGPGRVVLNANTVVAGNSSISGGGGIWLNAIAARSVSVVTIFNHGSGYTSPPSVTFTGGGSTIPATGFAVISGGMVTSVFVTNGGAGYMSAPIVSFSGGGGSGATAFATVDQDARNANFSANGLLVRQNVAAGATAIGGGIGGDGGDDIVSVANTSFISNLSAGKGGGFGVTDFVTNMSVTCSVFANNSAIGDGGAAYVNGQSLGMLFRSTAFQSNTSGGSGGGIFSSGNFFLQNVQLNDNTAGGNGGGIELMAQPFTANTLIVNSTITGNRALNSAGATNGGGIDYPATAPNGGLWLVSSTVNNNFATNGGGVFYGGGSSTFLIVQDTIIAQNVAAIGPDAANSAGAFTDRGGNVIGISGADSGNTGFTAATSQTGTVSLPLDPLLGLLQNNGGPTIGSPNNLAVLLTEALLLGSPAIDRGVTQAFVQPVDARGFNRIVNNTIDVGAYEFQPPATTTTLVVTTPPPPFLVQPGQTIPLQATVAATAPGSNVPTGTVTFFDNNRAIATVTLTNGHASITSPPLAPGFHRFKAIYNGLIQGDFSFASSSSVLSLNVSGGIFAIGGSPGRVQVRHVSVGSLVLDFQPYGPSYTGSVSVALGDVNGDGFPDLVTGATVGNPDVRVFDGKMLAQGTAMQIAQFFPYALQFNVGANVAVGDINNDGFADIVTGASVGNPDVRVYNGKDIANGTFNPNGSSLLAQWFPYALQFNVGANVAVGDISANGFADVVTGPTTGNPDVRVYKGQDIANGTFNPLGTSLLAQFFPYALGINTGAYVAVGDTNGDGFADVITGTTISIGQPDVRVFDGKAIAQGTFNLTASQLTQFFAFTGNRRGVTVAAADFEGTGMYDILTGAAADTGRYRVVKGNATGTEPPAVNGIDMVALDFIGGVNVGA